MWLQFIVCVLICYVVVCFQNTNAQSQVPCEYNTSFAIVAWKEKGIYFKTISNSMSDDEVTTILLQTRVRSLEEGTFTNMAKLRMIIMKAMGIEHLKPGFIKNLPNLQEIYASNNHITIIVKEVFNEFTLNYLDLNSNHIKNISDGAFENIKVRWLNLGNNQLLEVQKNWFNNSFIEIIDLSYNKIVSVNENVFSKVKNLKTINLNYNRIYFIAEETFSGHKYPLQLYLAGNSLNDIDFLDNVLIDTLDIGFNKISNVKTPISKKIKKILIYPNPWNCACLQKFWKYSWKHNIQYDYSITLRMPMADIPICLMPHGECDVYSDVQFERLYFESVDYIRLGAYDYRN